MGVKPKMFPRRAAIPIRILVYHIQDDLTTTSLLLVGLQGYLGAICQIATIASPSSHRDSESQSHVSALSFCAKSSIHGAEYCYHWPKRLIFHLFFTHNRKTRDINEGIVSRSPPLCWSTTPPLQFASRGSCHVECFL